MNSLTPRFSKLTSGLLLTTCLATATVACSNQSPPVATSPAPAASPSPAQPVAAQPDSGPKSETTRQLETKLQELMKTDIPVPVKSVSCPNQIEVTAGKSYTCATTIDAGQFNVKVDIKDNTGKFQLQTEGLLLLSKVEDLFESAIKEKSKLTVKANCGDQVRLFQKVGEEFQCELTTADGKKSPGQVKVTDMEGGVDVSWKIKP